MVLLLIVNDSVFFSLDILMVVKLIERGFYTSPSTNNHKQCIFFVKYITQGGK